MSQKKPNKQQLELAINNLQEALKRHDEYEIGSSKVRMLIKMALGNLGVADAYPEYTIGE